MGFGGDLDSFGLANIFQTLMMNQQSGVLRVRDRLSDKVIFFSQGMIRCSSSGGRSSIPLGELLVAHGKINAFQLAEALAKRPTDDRLLGEILVDQGSCSETDIDAVLRFQMEEEIYDLFTWESASFDFSDAQPDQASQQAADQAGGALVREATLNTSAIVMEAARRVDEWGRLKDVIPSVSAVLVPEEHLAGGNIPDGFSPEQVRILAYVDGFNNVSDIISKSLMGRFNTTVFLASCVRQGWLREATAEEMVANAEKALLQGGAAEAAKLYRRAMEKGGNTSLRKLLAAALEAAGDAPGAAMEWRAAAADAAAAGDAALSAELVEKAGRLGGQTDEDLQQLGSLHFAAGRSKEAAEAWIKLVRQRLEAKRPMEALEICVKALASLPGNDALTHLLARAQLDLGHTKEAAEVYERIGRSCEVKGDISGAVAAYRSAAKLDSAKAELKGHAQELLAYASENRQQRKYRFLGMALAAVAVVFALVIAFLEIRAGMRFDAQQKASASLESAAASAKDIDVKIRNLEQALASWQEFRPDHSFRGFVQKSSEEIDRVKALLDDAKKSQEKVSQAKVSEGQTRLEQALLAINSGDPKARVEALKALKSLAADTDAGEWADRAAKRYDEETKAEREAQAVEARSRQPGRSQEDRFRDIMELISRFPQSEAAKKAVMPVRLRLRPALVADVSFNGKAIGRTSATGELEVELPASGQFEISVKRPGFGNQEGITAWKGQEHREPVKAIDLERTIAWNVRVDGVPAMPVWCGRKLVVATSSGQIIAFDPATGKREKYLDGGQERLDFRFAPVFFNDKIFALSAEGRLICLEAASGRRIFPPQGGRNGYEEAGISSAAFIANLSFFGGQPFLIAGAAGGRVICLDCDKGNLRWQYDSKGARPVTAAGLRLNKLLAFCAKGGDVFLLREDGQVDQAADTEGGGASCIATDGKDIFAGLEGGGVRCWRVTSGKPELGWKSSEKTGPVKCIKLAGDMVFAACENRSAYAFESATGKVVWRNTQLSGAAGEAMEYIPGTGADGVARLFISCGNELACLSAATGEVLWKKRFEGKNLAGFAIQGGRIAVAGDEGVVYMLEEERAP